MAKKRFQAEQIIGNPRGTSGGGHSLSSPVKCVSSQRQPVTVAELLLKSQTGSEHSHKWLGFWLVSETVKRSIFASVTQT
jgi:hypothetical protein